MTNIERLTASINACRHPRAIYNAMLVLAPIIRKAGTEQQREHLLEDLKKEAANA